MLSAFVHAFRTPDLRKKLLFTIGIIVVFRFGSFIPTPGVSYTAVQECRANAADNAIFGLVNLFSGGALLSLTIFALGIMPYITSSIIIQLLTVVIPRFEALKKEGQSGTAKMTQYTRYLTVALAVLQASGMVAMARNPQQLFGPGCTVPIIPNDHPLRVLLMILVMTAGTAVIMWFGELITDRGIGNGMSILIFTTVAAGFPSALWNLKQNEGWFAFLAFIAVGLAIIVLVVFIEQAQRRIPVQYAKRMVGRRQYGGTSTYIPIKVNQAGVIPVIFATSLLYVPSLIAQLGGNSTAKWRDWIQTYFASNGHPVSIISTFLLVVFFTYFYVSITFNPREVADNMKKYGGFIPGIRAGNPTADYLQYVLSRLTFPGSIYLALVAILPNLFFLASPGVDPNTFPFGGTAILIVVGVGLETVKQVEAQLQQRNYEGFLR